MKTSAVAIAVLALTLPACNRADSGEREPGLVTGLRAVFAFRTCASKLEDRFGLKEISGVTSNDMDPRPTGRPGEWDVRFTADVTETPTGRITRYKGVCRVRRDKPTTLDAQFVKEIRAGAHETVRRVRPH
jgi:hypothetical protein